VSRGPVWRGWMAGRALFGLFFPASAFQSFSHAAAATVDPAGSARRCSRRFPSWSWYCPGAGRGLLPGAYSARHKTCLTLQRAGQRPRLVTATIRVEKRSETWIERCFGPAGPILRVGRLKDGPIMGAGM
jgi:hypothetical protein